MCHQSDLEYRYQRKDAKRSHLSSLLRGPRVEIPARRCRALAQPAGKPPRYRNTDTEVTDVDQRKSEPEAAAAGLVGRGAGNKEEEPRATYSVRHRHITRHAHAGEEVDQADIRAHGLV